MFYKDNYIGDEGLKSLSINLHYITNLLNLNIYGIYH